MSPASHLRSNNTEQLRMDEDIVRGTDEGTRRKRPTSRQSLGQLFKRCSRQHQQDTIGLNGSEAFPPYKVSAADRHGSFSTDNTLWPYSPADASPMQEHPISLLSSPQSPTDQVLNPERRMRYNSACLFRGCSKLSDAKPQRAHSVSGADRTLLPPNAIKRSTSAPPNISASWSGDERQGRLPTPSFPLDDVDKYDNSLSPAEANLLDSDNYYDLSSTPSKRELLQEEYDRCWILNLSMRFRDKSNREKFFVTYAERANSWRRLTISLDYANALDGSLETELCKLHYQQDKSMRIFESIKDSLPDIEYYATVTNLKLETSPEDGQLHIHVREDANEIIQYPSTSLIQHIEVPKVPEADVQFIGHLSGFVYKVRVGHEVMIKKEIPGPDTVDEFLYEVNALSALLEQHSINVVQLKGLVTDDDGSIVKGLLISYAPKGALVDMLYDSRNTDYLPWYRREKWARQIVSGLSDIHEAGFVQGDFTLSNIVLDECDNAKLIDINRRGCPVGWEPPEFSRLIESGQRIGMCIGVKTDLFQLGMVLWALAEEVDEPERVERPLPQIVDTVPEYYRKIVAICLSERPQGRMSAKALLKRFPASAGDPYYSLPPPDDSASQSDQCLSASTHRSDKEYIDPDLAVTIDEVSEQCRMRLDNTRITDLASANVTYLEPSDSRDASTSYQVESTGSWIVPARSRNSKYHRSPVSSRRRRSSPLGRPPSSVTSISSVSSAGRGPRSERKYVLTDSVDLQEGKISAGCLTCHTPDCAVSDDGERMNSASDRAIQSQCTIPFTYLDLYRGLRNPPQHQDSGFDETMLESLTLDYVETVKPCSSQGSKCIREQEANRIPDEAQQQ